MRGFATNVLATVSVIAVVVLLAYLVFVGIPTQVKIIQQPAAPTGPAAPAEKNIALWNVLVTLKDTDGKPVYDANVYILYEKPKNIYETPTDDIYAQETNADKFVLFENVPVGKYYALASASGYYNAGTDFEVPSKVPADWTKDESPINVEITMAHKGTILGVQVPLTYRGSSADIAKLVYNEDTELYETDFQYVASTDGEVRYKEIRIDLNTDNLGTATIDKLTVTVGDQEFEFDNVTGAKTIKFDEEQVIPKGATLEIKLAVDGTDLGTVSGELFKITLYDVQEGEYTATVEGPA